MTEQVRNPQLDVIETLDRPVIVQAGAGSGKTHTLTERIIASLTKDESGESFARSIENVVAITFTHKAAEELKARLRTKLEKAGMHDQALLVDDAFVTTIHGFASRILKENALQFGIDANFELLDEAKEEDIFQQAMPEAIKSLCTGKQLLKDLEDAAERGLFHLKQIDDLEDIEDLDDLEGFDDVEDFDDFDIEELKSLPDFDANDFQEISNDIFSSDSPLFLNDDLKEQIASMIKDVVKAQSMDAYGELFINKIFADDATSTSDSIDMIKRMVNALSLVSNEEAYHVFVGTHLAYEEIASKASRCIAEALSLINFDLEDDGELELMEQLRHTQLELDDLLADDLENTMEDIAEIEVGELLDEAPKLSAKFHKNRSDYAAVVSYRETLARLAIEFFSRANKTIMECAYTLAHQVLIEMNEQKSGTYLSNNDLLRVCCQMLSRNPALAKSYRDKFDLIMIDEFQDTDNLQMELIGLISKDNFSNVCTVGDVQQSIYRFRGANVGVFKAYKDKMKLNGSNVRIVNLPNNYRSHADVLALTDKIFASSDMFGEDFLHLYPKGKINDEEDATFKEMPRIQIEVMNHQTQGKVKFLTKDAVQREARKAAMHFKQLKDAGENPGSMAVLLSRLTSGATMASPLEIGKIYSDELAKVGIESIISGGTTFARSVEAQTVLALLSIARNAFDSESLAYLLKSDFFSLSDDAMLVLATSFSNAMGSDPSSAMGSDPSSVKKRDIARGFLSIDESQLQRLSEQDKKACLFAQARIVTFIENARSNNVIDAMRLFLSECGVFDNLQKMSSEGLVRAGNYEKAFSILKEITNETKEIPEIHVQYSKFLEYAKEAPGILSTVKSDYVQIMTVHASKGLEFDHVVLSELRDGKSRRQNMIIKETSLENVGDRFLCLAGIKNLDYPDLKKFAFDKNLSFSHDVVSHRTMTAGELYVKMVMKEEQEELDEAKRLLYVGITRAVKSVLLQVRINKKAKDDYEGTGIWKNFYDVFQWDYSCAKSTQFFELGNGSTGKLTFESLPQALEFEEEDSESDVDESMPVTNMCEYVVRRAPRKLKRINEDERKSDFVAYSNLEKATHDASYLQIAQAYPLSGEEELEGRENLSACDSDKATDFGTQLHTFFERGVINGKFDPALLHSKRLEAAVMRVFSTKDFVAVMESENVIPEMEFCVPLEMANETKFLRGEMDLVALGDEDAHVIDYKTGKRPIDHTLQAQIYAYALLKAKKQSVRLSFIHAEIPAPEGGGAFLQIFQFSQSDLLSLEDEICNKIKEAKL